jgi:hypothetical protein
LFEYWFEGKQTAGRTRRWSLVRDVLCWGNEQSEECGENEPAAPLQLRQEPPVEKPLATPAAPVVEPAPEEVQPTRETGSAALDALDDVEREL